MKKMIIILLVIFSCSKNDDKDIEKYPECLDFEVSQVLDAPPTSVRANIKKYSYLNMTVYAFFEGNVVEGQTRVYDKSCNLVCEYGGIGNVNTCENWENAEFIETVWTDNR